MVEVNVKIKGICINVTDEIMQEPGQWMETYKAAQLLINAAKAIDAIEKKEKDSCVGFLRSILKDI